jgi:tripartite-type tricarboxylate transporter receptor subunit TctC
VRASTPPAIANRLAKALSDSLGDRDIVAKIEKAGVSVENIGPEETKKFLANEQKRWSEVAKIAKLD